MKAKWIAIVDNAQGGLDHRHYARLIPGNEEWAAICEKPELSKATKKMKGNLPHVKAFNHVIALCKEILHNPEKRSVWQVRYEEAKRQAQRHAEPIQGRLCDYVRHEVSAALKRGGEIA